MKKLIAILVGCVIITSVLIAQSPFSRELDKNVNLESWQRALGITNGVTTNNFYTTLTNILYAGTNVTLTFSNNSIFINSTTNNGSGSNAGITNIVLISTNLIITGSPVVTPGGTFTIDLPFLTNWFADTNIFRQATNMMADTNIFRLATNGMVVKQNNNTLKWPLLLTNYTGTGGVVLNTNADGSLYMYATNITTTLTNPAVTNNASYTAISTTLNTVLTNSSTNISFVTVVASLAGTVGSAVITLYIESPAGTFNAAAQSQDQVGANRYQISGIVAPAMRYYYTNNSTGGGSASIVVNTAWRVNIFIGNN